MVSFFRIKTSIVFSMLSFMFAIHGFAGADEMIISDSWKIHIPSNAPVPVVKAARDLQDFLGNRHALELEITDTGTAPGIYVLIDDKMKNDGFSIKAIPSKKQIRIQAPGARAVFQGILELEDELTGQPAISKSFNKDVTYPFSDRYLVWDVNLTGQNKMAVGFDLEKHIREAVRMGYSGIECNRFLGTNLLLQYEPEDSYPWYTYYGPSMDQFVSSPLFEGVYPKKYLDNNLSDLKHVVEVVRSYGLKPIFVGYEPRYVPDEFLKKHPELRGPRVDHPLRSIHPRYSLCTDRKEVQEHYRALAKKLGEEVPDLAAMFIIYHDSGAGLCWYDALYRGRNGPAHCKNIPMEERMGKFFGAIQQGLKDAGLDIPIIAQPHKSSKADIDAFFQGVSEGITMTAGNWASWKLAYPDPLDVDLYVMDLARKTGRKVLYYQQHFTGFDIAPTTEYPVPYILAARLKRTKEMDLDALTTLGGISSPPVKKQSVNQEVYRTFLLDPGMPDEDLVKQVAVKLGGEKGGPVLEEIWKEIDVAIKKNGNLLGFARGVEYASRRTLVRPMVPDQAALLPSERDWWLRYTFSGYQRFNHAHMFRNEGGTPSEEWYRKNLEQSIRYRDVFRASSRRLQDFIAENPDIVRQYPYLGDHERQLRFLGHVYGTGAFLYESQAILDKYNEKNIWEGAKKTVDADALRFKELVNTEIGNTRAFIDFLNEGGDIGMVLLPEETTWGYSDYLPVLLEKKIDIMQKHLPEIDEVLNRWFNSEY